MSKIQIPMEHGFSPYTDNGGTSLAIAGKDFCIVAADTRQSEGYSINSRYAPKAFQLANGTVLGTGGMYADAVTLVKMIGMRLEWYEHKHAKSMSAPATAQMLSTMLYQKRFFPYYVWNTLGGLDENGNGCVFSYDPVGNFEKSKYNCAGSAGHLIQPFLDNQIGRKHINGPVEHSIDEIKRIVKDAFTSATERDIYTGDFLEIFTITSQGTTKELIPLKKD
ncbi:nucleophile aminohydrolase [Globomyces pollinis-pini]|nr:nucleophile aminohydrolase [Globomyces pollinis-pini]